MRTCLGISLSDVDTLDSKVHHELGPFLLVPGFLRKVEIGVLGQVEESLLDEPADHAWVGSAAGNCSCFVVVLADIMEESLPESVVASLLKTKVFIGVVSFPLLLDSVDIEDSLLLAVLHDLRGGGSYREVDTKAYLAHKHLVQYRLEVVLVKPLLNELSVLELVGQVHWIWVDDGQLVESEVPPEQGHGSSPD